MDEIDSALGHARRARPAPLPPGFASQVLREVHRPRPAAPLLTPATLGASFAGAVAVALAVTLLASATPQAPADPPPLAGFSAFPASR